MAQTIFIITRSLKTISESIEGVHTTVFPPMVAKSRKEALELIAMDMEAIDPINEAKSHYHDGILEALSFERRKSEEYSKYEFEIWKEEI